MNFLINKEGRITQGQYKGWYVMIEPYEVGQYLILICNRPFNHSKESDTEGYDNFAEDSDVVNTYVEEWGIIWNEG